MGALYCAYTIPSICPKYVIYISFLILGASGSNVNFTVQNQDSVGGSLPARGIAPLSVINSCPRKASSSVSRTLIYSKRRACQKFNLIDRVGGFRPLTHHRTCLLWHTAVSRRVIGPGTNVPAATLYLSSSDTLSTPPHCYVDSDLHRFPSFSRGFVHFSTSWLCCYRF